MQVLSANDLRTLAKRLEASYEGAFPVMHADELESVGAGSVMINGTAAEPFAKALAAERFVEAPPCTFAELMRATGLSQHAISRLFSNSPCARSIKPEDIAQTLREMADEIESAHCA